MDQVTPEGEAALNIPRERSGKPLFVHVTPSAFHSRREGAKISLDFGTTMWTFQSSLLTFLFFQQILKQHTTEAFEQSKVVR